MSKHSATAARKHFSELLDAAEAGEAVLVERRGRVFRVALLLPEAIPAEATPLFVADESILSGEWGFTLDGSFIPGGS